MCTTEEEALKKKVIRGEAREGGEGREGPGRVEGRGRGEGRPQKGIVLV